jgi:hypothetical protein
MTKEEVSMDGRGNWIGRWSCAVIATAMAAQEVAAQPPVPPSGPSAPVVCTRRGRLHRMFHHTAHVLENDVVGHPDNFIEPPLGYYVNQQFAVQVAKADTHRFTLYNSDFLPGTNRFSPIGASRFNLMFARLPDWSGPIVVQWSPDQPALAQARRQAVVETLTSAGLPVMAERVVIGPSPYPGAMGVEAAGQATNTIFRNQSGSQTFPLPPTESASMGVR